MAQYDPLAVKSGIPSVLGTATCRADLTAVAGMTTAGLAAGDVVQVTGALTLSKALCTLVTPCAGVYDGVSGSIIREGVVVATLAAGVALVAGDAVYLSTTPGAITNVKPTTDYIHEVGVVVDAAAAKVMWQPKPVISLSSSMMMMDARSSWLLQGDTPPTEPGEQQAFPTTAAALLAALGSPAGWTTANCIGGYLCNTASPLVDSFGVGPNFTQYGSPLTARECVGLPTASFNSKTGIECWTGGGNGFGPPGGSTAYCDANGSIVSVLAVSRIGTTAAGIYSSAIQKINAGVGSTWEIIIPAAGIIFCVRLDGVFKSTVAFEPDGAWHCYAAVLDDVAHTIQTLSDFGDGALNAVGALSNNGTVSIGDSGAIWMQYAQLAAVYFFDRALTSAMRTTFWRAYQSGGLGTANTYTRTNPIVVPISATRVACYAANQPCIAYDGSLIAGTDNTLKTGLLAENGYSFLGIGSNNPGAWTYGVAGGSPAVVDGPSGMREAIRAVDSSGAAAEYVQTGLATLTGATHVWHVFGFTCQDVVGSTCQVTSYFSGDAGGPEELAILGPMGAPAAWSFWTGAGGIPTYWGSCMPVGNAHTQVRMRLYPTNGVAASTGTIDFAECWGIQGTPTPPIAWRRVGAGTTAATSTPSLTYTNVGNARYNPVGGWIKLRISGFQGTSGAFFLTCGAAGADGALTLSYNAGQLIYRIWDGAGVLVDAVNCGGVSTAQHEYDVNWNSAAGTMSLLEGGVVLGSSSPGAWVPEAADVTPIYVGCDSTGANAARCLIALLDMFAF